MKTKDKCDEKDRVGWEYFSEIDPTSKKFKNSRRKILRLENVFQKYNC